MQQVMHRTRWIDVTYHLALKLNSFCYPICIFLSRLTLLGSHSLSGDDVAVNIKNIY